MTRMQLFAVALLALTAARTAVASKVTPVEKVLEMLNEMLQKGIAELEAEQKVWREYTEWVDDQDRELGFQIKTLGKEIDDYVVQIDDFQHQIEHYGGKIVVAEKEIYTIETEIARLKGIRDGEHAEFLKEQQELNENIDALERAIAVLEAEPKSVAQAEMLLQRMADSMPGMPRVLAAFLAEKSSSERTLGGPDVVAYENHSSPIIEMLKKLLEKFRDQLDACEEEEANRAHAYDLELLHLKASLEQLKGSVSEWSVTKTTMTAKSGEAQGASAAAKGDKGDAEKMLADLWATWRLKKEQYEANQKVRKAEIEALKKAIEIISSPDVAGSYSTHVKLAQVASGPVSLLQVSTASQRVASKQRARSYLQHKAASLRSASLGSLAAQMLANPFAKVVDMIEKLIAKLKEEAAAEAEHKGWCDDQLNKNKLKREKKTLAVDKLAAQIAQLEGEIDTMGKQIETLVKEQAELTKAMAEATKLREEEKAENAVTIKDAKAAQEAVKMALEILNQFYDSQSALLQQVPAMKPYKGMQNSKGGVIGMLEVILSDFVRVDSETTADEKTSQMEYDKFMTDAKADKKAKHKSEVQLKLDKDQAEFEKSELAEDKVVVDAELAKANEYFEFLKPSCLEVKVSFEERAKKRQEEIDALKEAYGILNN